MVCKGRCKLHIYSIPQSHSSPSLAYKHAISRSTLFLNRKENRIHWQCNSGQHMFPFFPGRYRIANAGDSAIFRTNSMLWRRFWSNERALFRFNVFALPKQCTIVSSEPSFRTFKDGSDETIVHLAEIVLNMYSGVADNHLKKKSSTSLFNFFL